MYPPIFGPILWDGLHLMAFSYPDTPSKQRQESFQDMLKNMAENLPCPGCSLHFGKYLEQHPCQTESKDKLKKWLHKFHNTVNLRTGKREMTEEEAEERFKEKYFTREHWVEIKRAQEMRREDHTIIEKWKHKAKDLALKLGQILPEEINDLEESELAESKKSEENPSTKEESSKTAKIWIGVLSFLVVTLLIAVIVILSIFI